MGTTLCDSPFILRHTMRSICITIFCAAVIIAVGFATDEESADTIITENIFSEVTPLSDETTLVESLSSDELELVKKKLIKKMKHGAKKPIKKKPTKKGNAAAKKLGKAGKKTAQDNKKKNLKIKADDKKKKDKAKASAKIRTSKKAVAGAKTKAAAAKNRKVTDGKQQAAKKIAQ